MMSDTPTPDPVERQETVERISALIDALPEDDTYVDRQQALQRRLEGKLHARAVECTLRVTKRRKVRVVSVYDQHRHAIWCDKVLDLSDHIDRTKTWHGQLLYGRIFLEVASQGPTAEQLAASIAFVAIDTSTPRKYCCDAMKYQFTWRHGLSDFPNLGIKPYKSSVYRWIDGTWLTSSSHGYNNTLAYCPFCGAQLAREASLNRLQVE